MKRSFSADICCPVCGGSFELKANELREEDVIEGVLGCTKCFNEYPVRKGIPHLISEKGWGDSKTPEMQGWVNLWKKKGMYDRPTPADDSLRLPYVDGIWAEHAKMFDLSLQELNLQGYESILDLGAGQGWACRYFAEKGCRAIAMDIVDDEWWGLGRAWAIMEHAQVYFEPLIADGENLPFRPEKFDIVFLSAALHHFNHIDRVLAQCYRVLKPGGRIIANPEPAISIFFKERDVSNALEETQENIIERRPKTFQYWLAFKQAGFCNLQTDVFETYRAEPVQVYRWIRTIGRTHYSMIHSYYKPAARLLNMLALKLPRPWAVGLTLCLYGGNLFIRAIKPAGKVKS